MMPEVPAVPEVMPSYARIDIAFARGEGAYLFAEDGRRFLDFATGIAVNALGHGHPHLIEALTRQAGVLWHCSNLYRIPDQDRLARRLVANSFADTAFFCNSGAEALEAGFKLVRKYHHDTGNPDRYRILALEGAFHGRTLAAIAAGDNAAHQAGFGPLVDGFDHAAPENMNEVRDRITGETAAILVEPVQGEGGIKPLSPGFLRDLRNLCDEAGLLLFFDEVQCGMGRTGRLFAYEWSGVTPDVMALAKGLGGGFPVAVCLATARAAVGITAGTHGSTFGGNPLAMAVANAVLDVMLESGFLDGVVATGGLLADRLATLPKRWPKVVDSVRGVGLMVGIRCLPANRTVVERLRENGLLTVPAADNVVRLLPPLNITELHVDEAMVAIEAVCGELTP